MEGRKEEEQVMSEVHLGCPPGFSGSYVSHFTFSLPSTDMPDERYDDRLKMQVSSSQEIILDDDGDLLLTRRNNKNRRYLNYGFTIRHNITSSLGNVGLQVWRAALVLTDFVLHKSLSSSDFNDIIALELGAGTGLIGIALARVARTVFITDRGTEVLNNCAANVQLNSGLLKFHEPSIHIRELDWKESWPPNLQTCDLSSQQRMRYSWASSEIEEAERATLLLAADVIYSDELTDSFFSILERLMSRGSEKVLYLALEKRYNFSLEELDVVANGYAHFRSFLKDDEEYGGHDDALLPCFVGELIDLGQIPQYIREYERGKDLEIWKITYCLKRLNLYNNILRPSKLAAGADFSCFKYKIEPKWEDPVCANGGKWTISCSRGKVDTWWLYTLLAMLGEQFDHGEEICGAVINVRAKQEKISIWTKNGLNEAAQVSIGKQWKVILDYNDTIGFILHDDAKKHDRFAKSRYQI